jgi:hypothetical protein
MFVSVFKMRKRLNSLIVNSCRFKSSNTLCFSACDASLTLLKTVKNDKGIQSIYFTRQCG